MTSPENILIKKLELCKHLISLRLNDQKKDLPDDFYVSMRDFFVRAITLISSHDFEHNNLEQGIIISQNTAQDFYTGVSTEAEAMRNAKHRESFITATEKLLQYVESSPKNPLPNSYQSDLREMLLDTGNEMAEMGIVFPEGFFPKLKQATREAGRGGIG